MTTGRSKPLDASLRRVLDSVGVLDFPYYSQADVQLATEARQHWPIVDTVMGYLERTQASVLPAQPTVTRTAAPPLFMPAMDSFGGASRAPMPATPSQPTPGFEPASSWPVIASIISQPQAPRAAPPPPSPPTPPPRPERVRPRVRLRRVGLHFGRPALGAEPIEQAPRSAVGGGPLKDRG